MINEYLVVRLVAAVLAFVMLAVVAGADALLKNLSGSRTSGKQSDDTAGCGQAA